MRGRRRIGVFDALQGGIKDRIDDISTIRDYDHSTGWIYVGAGSGAPAFQNSWFNYDAVTYTSVAFKRVSGGIVYLEGLLAGGTSGSTVFNLPAGFRPGKNQNMKIFYFNGTTHVVGTIGIATTGDLSLNYLNGAVTFASLDGLSFPAEG